VVKKLTTLLFYAAPSGRKWIGGFFVAQGDAIGLRYIAPSGRKTSIHNSFS